MTQKTLIAGSAYIDTEPLRELCKLWSRVVTHLDPNCDVVIIDSASPFEPSAFLDWPVVNEDAITSAANDAAQDRPRRVVYRFADNIGHLSRGGEDGGGRTYCKAVELAINGGYDWLVFIETDLLFYRSVSQIVQSLAQNGTKIAALPNQQYQFPEFGVSFINVAWAKEFNFIKKYNWKGSQPWPIPEVRLMNLLKDYLVLLPLYGMRIDQTGVTAETLPNYFPYFSPSWLTHAPNLDIYMRGIMLSNIQLP